MDLIIMKSTNELMHRDLINRFEMHRIQSTKQRKKKKKPEVAAKVL